MATFYTIQDNLPIDYNLFSDKVKEFIGTETSDLQSLGEALSGKIHPHPEILGKVAVFIPEKGSKEFSRTHEYSIKDSIAHYSSIKGEIRMLSWVEYLQLNNEKRKDDEMRCQPFEICDLNAIYPADYRGQKNDYHLLKEMMETIYHQHILKISRYHPIQLFFIHEDKPLYLEIFEEREPHCNGSDYYMQINFCQSRTDVSHIASVFKESMNIDNVKSWAMSGYNSDGLNESWESSDFAPNKCRLAILDSFFGLKAKGKKYTPSEVAELMRQGGGHMEIVGCDDIYIGGVLIN